jgi:hypothetical protein
MIFLLLLVTITSSCSISFIGREQLSSCSTEYYYAVKCDKLLYWSPWIFYEEYPTFFNESRTSPFFFEQNGIYFLPTKSGNYTWTFIEKSGMLEWNVWLYFEGNSKEEFLLLPFLI